MNKSDKSSGNYACRSVKHKVINMFFRDGDIAFHPVSESP